MRCSGYSVTTPEARSSGCPDSQYLLLSPRLIRTNTRGCCGPSCFRQGRINPVSNAKLPITHLRARCTRQRSCQCFSEATMFALDAAFRRHHCCTAMQPPWSAQTLQALHACCLPNPKPCRSSRRHRLQALNPPCCHRACPFSMPKASFCDWRVVARSCTCHRRCDGDKL